ncbi:AAA family ATPase, partial [candidate division CSSED10-310 bacterium]
MIKLPGYHITEHLYQSSNSLIYRGFREENKTPVIIKFLNKEYPKPRELAQFQREYELTRKLDLDGIIKTYDLEKYKSTQFMVLEDFGGISLAHYLSEQKIELRQSLSLAIRIADTVAKIHQHNIIHKDINPSNIVWNPGTDLVKLIDFGISTELTRENPEIKNLQVLEGTLSYISPEQTGRMNRSLDYRTDLYSLGVTLYQLFTHRLPFEATDTVELVHLHISKSPPVPSEIVSDVAPVLSDIILKLMSKTPEDRYQSASGLKADLQNCTAQLQSSGSIQRFAIAQNDVSDKFHISEKIYGREREIEFLEDVFDRISLGAKEVVIISGSSGIGKSALVNEVQKKLIKRKGYFLSGRFNQFQRHIPYSAIIQVFQGLVQQLLLEREEELSLWRERICAAVGPNGRVITDVIPEVEHVIGKQPPMQELTSEASQIRFNLTFQVFIRSFTSQEHPLVLFIEDWQWADGSSLQLLNQIMSDRGTGYLLLIGTYRQNEVQADHLTLLALSDLQKAGVAIHRIDLKQLEFDQINFFISDTLLCSRDQSRPLAQVCIEKTGGNPFFLSQFLGSLYDAGWIGFNSQRGVWLWDLEHIKAMKRTDNVIDAMIAAIKKMSSDTQTILK